MDSREYIVQGFKASAVAAGIKKKGGLDLALIFSERGAAAAGVFTMNKVKAAPVILSQENIRRGRVKAVLANSGNANACTGREGLENARATADLVARELGTKSEEVLVASTGVIGAPLDVDLFTRAMPGLVKNLSPDGIPLVVQAIMTTDSFPKISLFDGVVGGRPFRILGIAKGAGMIMPQMATMLSFILSDIDIDPSQLGEAVSSSVASSFNRISVDGDTSTNDMVLVLANGLAGNGALGQDDYKEFKEGLSRVMGELATMIVQDGEGATKVVHIYIKGAASSSDAITGARAVANSSLVKTAFYGQDPNWGRIMAALGRSGISMREEEVSIWVDEVKIVEKGMGRGEKYEKEAAAKMLNKAFAVTVELRQGKYDDRMITCDLTHEYVSINANYRT
ncbi:MAG: bifunctional glutamate N-acetyltransferase/amino-acid acetyltransferase ArgJ [Proteobacteria bacterium]|nr:bifunctional glutamate N-acetyltransferase/amino-acid acetyltransferase ArgJ [Pseudomonadota bacterium]